MNFYIVFIYFFAAAYAGEKYSCPEDRKAQYCEPCAGTCDNPNLQLLEAWKYGSSPPPCPLICIIGKYCSCPKGSIQRSADDLECVDIQECVEKAHKKICGDRRYSTCSPCEGTCNNPNMGYLKTEDKAAAACTLQCEFGDFCQCPEGQMQRSATNQTCVPQEECIAEEERIQNVMAHIRTHECPLVEEIQCSPEYYPVCVVENVTENNGRNMRFIDQPNKCTYCSTELIYQYLDGACK